MQTKRRGVSKAITGAAMILVGLFAGGAFFVGYAFAAPPATLQVQTNVHINSGGTAQIHVNIQHGAPSSSYAVKIAVTAPSPTTVTSPTKGVSAGGPFCDTIAIATDAGGNGGMTVSYPDTLDPSSLFAPCSSTAPGGPTTIVAGTYSVTASTTGLTSASTGFTVLPPQHTVDGTGTSMGQSTTTSAFIPATGCGAGTGTCVESCTGPVLTTAASPSATSSPSTSTAPYFVTLVGTSELFGTISTNTPGTAVVQVIQQPCGQATGTRVSAGTTIYNFNDVTINSPDNPSKHITGGLVWTVTYTGTSSSTTTGTTTVTRSLTLAHFTVKGTGGLEGVSGIGESSTQATTTTVIGSPGVLTASGVYWVQLNNVPGADGGEGGD